MTCQSLRLGKSFAVKMSKDRSWARYHRFEFLGHSTQFFGSSCSLRECPWPRTAEILRAPHVYRQKSKKLDKRFWRTVPKRKRAFACLYENPNGLYSRISFSLNWTIKIFEQEVHVAQFS